MSDLRPTLFLAQLSNLLAGNISIVHGVTGSSRTFMGEEAAGVDAVRIALSRIVAGQSDIALVGGAHNGERPDLLMLYEFGGYCLKDNFAPVWERGENGGFALGSLGAFLVLEAREHAEARGAKPLARLTAVLSDRSDRRPGAIASALTRMWDKIKGKLKPGHTAVLSGATGAVRPSAEERAFLEAHGAQATRGNDISLAVRATGSYFGHGLESQFPMNVALAAIALGHGRLFPPTDATGLEQPMHASLDQVVVTGVGHWRGIGLALVDRVG
jgi:3-oxoacyl-[acyl-carrier-protein] synthase II